MPLPVARVPYVLDADFDRRSLDQVADGLERSLEALGGSPAGRAERREGGVGLGSEVTVENVETGQEVRYTLVIPEVADGKKNFVSIASPVGRALLNRRPGEEVTVQVPKGTMELAVTGVVTVFGDTLG